MSSTATRTALEPFRALRYDQSKVTLGDVVAPPYDVITPAQRDELIRQCEYCIVRLELPDSARTAGDLLHRWRREGILLREEQPALWWHEQTFTGPDGIDRVRCGFLATVRLTPYDQGPVRPHEQTHTATRAERLELLRATATNLSPIFALYDDPGHTVTSALSGVDEAPPAMEAADPDGTMHRFWPVTDADRIAAVQAAMAGREIVIADGHHRYETSLAYRAEQREREGQPAGDRPYDFIMMALSNLSDPGLAIFPTHRVVVSMREVDRRFLGAFRVRELAPGTPATEVEAELAALPRDSVAFAVWRGSEQPPMIAELIDPTAAMLAMPGAPKPVRSLDAAVLESLVLAPLLGLEPEKFRTTEGVLYTRSLDYAAALVEAGDAGSVFILRPPTVEQVQAVVAAGRVMPQKSTYFFPKLWSGFVLNPLSND